MKHFLKRLNSQLGLHSVWIYRSSNFQGKATDRLFIRNGWKLPYYCRNNCFVRFNCAGQCDHMPLGYHQQISADVHQWFSCFVSHIWYSSWWCPIPGNSHYPRISGKWISYLGNSVIGNCKPLLHHFRSIHRRSPSILIFVFNWQVLH